MFHLSQLPYCGLICLRPPQHVSLSWRSLINTQSMPDDLRVTAMTTPSKPPAVLSIFHPLPAFH